MCHMLLADLMCEEIKCVRNEIRDIQKKKRNKYNRENRNKKAKKWLNNKNMWARRKQTIKMNIDTKKNGERRSGDEKSEERRK